MNPQQIRFEALKLAIASDGQRQFVVPSDVLITQAARFAEFILTGKTDASTGDQS